MYSVLMLEELLQVMPYYGIYRIAHQNNNGYKTLIDYRDSHRFLYGMILGFHAWTLEQAFYATMGVSTLVAQHIVK